MTEERLRELEWAATYLKSHKAPKGCRCAGTCARCRPYYDAKKKINAGAVLELIAVIREKAGICPSCKGSGEGPLVEGLMGMRETICATCMGSGRR